MTEDNRIRSALEIALEKVKQIEVSDDELERDEYLEKGKRLAAQYLKDTKFDLKTQVSSQSKTNKKYLLEGIETVLLQNIVLPQNERQKNELRKVLEGIVIIKDTKGPLSQVCAQLEQIFDQYDKVKKQNYNLLKQKFVAQFEEKREMMEQQMGTKIKIDVERQPEFQKTWQEMVRQINTEFESAVWEMKQYLKQAK